MHELSIHSIKNLILIVLSFNFRMIASIEAYTVDENTRDSLFFHRENKWYPNLHKNDENVILRRFISWHDETIFGDFGFYVYRKEMYDRIFEYFGLRKKQPPYLLSLLNSYNFEKRNLLLNGSSRKGQ